MGTVNMYTIVPVELATDLRERRKIKNYNNLKQISPAILEAIREFMTDNVGFSDLPMACLSLNKRAQEMGGDELFRYLPANNKESVLFQLQMPSDMIVSVSYSDLLDASQNAKACENDPEELEFIKEDFKDLLILGDGSQVSSEEEVMSFIPFLDYTYCKFYMKFNENFETDSFEMPGVERLQLTKLSAFID